MDVGLNLRADLRGTGKTLQLHSRVTQAAVADEKSNAGAKDPVIRQTSLDETLNLTPGQPLILGTLDIPGTTRQEQITVEAAPVS